MALLGTGVYVPTRHKMVRLQGGYGLERHFCSPQLVVFSSLFRQTGSIRPVVNRTVDCKQRTVFLEAQEATGGESSETSFISVC